MEVQIPSESLASEQEGPRSMRGISYRDLDFPESAHLTSERDILSYFEDESRPRQIGKINLKSVVCPDSEIMMSYLISRANTLVDINMHGIRFNDFQQLGHFLKPLIHIERLSVDLPDMKEVDIPLVSKVLQEPLKRLTYFSVKIISPVYGPWSNEFIRLLQLCEGLKEVLITQDWSNCHPPDSIENVKNLKNLEIVNYRGSQTKEFKKNFVTLLPDPEKWTDFPITMNSDPSLGGICLEKDVEVCEELLGKNVIRRQGVGSVLVPELLIKEVLKITHENVPEEFCCLSMSREAQAIVLKSEEAKRLLKNPDRFAIFYLCTNHKIESNCDVHLLASAFPNLTELILSSVTINDDSSFRMLVKNTPDLKHVTLRIPDNSEGEWDLSTLNLISSNWQSLETLHALFEPPAVFCSKNEVAEENFCENLISSTKELIHECRQLTALLFEIALKCESSYKMLSSGLKGLKAESSRSNLQILVTLRRNRKMHTKGLLSSCHVIHNDSEVDAFFSLTGKTPLFAVNRE